MIQTITHPYEQEKHFSVSLAGEQIDVISKPGLADWDQLPPSTQLLAEYPRLLPTDHVLFMGCHHGALCAFIARHHSQGKLSVTDISHIALEMTRKTLAANGISSVNIIPASNHVDTKRQLYDAVLIQIPKGRKLSRRWLLQAFQGIKQGGNVYISGSNRAGIQSSIKDAVDLFGNGRIMAYKKGNRISHLVKQPAVSSIPEWTSFPGLSPGTWIEFPVTISNQSYQICSLPGVFSFDHLDTGTEMLLKVVNTPQGCTVLDVGCGYGIIGLFVATHGAGWVDFIDSDLLAIASCKETLARNRVRNSTVFTSDLLEQVSSKKYDLILSNPPFHAGHAVDFQIAEAMIRQSHQVLNPGGRLSIVANRFIPYDRLVNGIFGNVMCVAESGRFHVLSGVRSV